MPLIARENTSLRLFRAEKTGFKSESDSEGAELFLPALSAGGVEGPNLLIAAFSLLAGDALSISGLVPFPSWSCGFRESRSIGNCLKN